MSDLVIQICDFHTPSKSTGKYIDKKSVEKVLKSSRFQSNLEKGLVAGLWTHKGRYESDDKNIPWEDNILTSKYLANVARNIWIDESTDSLMGEFDLLNTQYGNLYRDYVKKGINIPVSMSVSATADSKYYYVDDILGVDYTARPDLNAKIIKVNFSKKIDEAVIVDNEIKAINFSDSKVISFDLDNIENVVDSTPTLTDKNVERVNSSPCSYVVKKPGVKKEGEFSQENTYRPEVSKPTTYVTKKPIKNTEVQNEEVITNLNSVAGVDIDNVTPKLFDSLGITESNDLNISIDDIHKDIPIEDQLTLTELNTLPNEITSQINDAVKANFSIKKLIKRNYNRYIKKTGKTNFSINQYIMELNMQPYAILNRRINEVIQLCRSKKQEWINLNMDRLKSYFDSYVLTWINSTLNSINEFNIALGLRLNRFGVDQRKMRQLNLTIKRMKQGLAQIGYISKPIQQQLNTHFQSIENDLYAFIDSKIKSSGKTFLISKNTEDGKEKK